MNRNISGRLNRLVGAMFIGLTVVWGCGEGADPSTQSAIEQRLTCQCGCGLTVGNCNHVQCGFGIPAKQEIAESLARGETSEQIVARYQAEYGEKILSSPTLEGFNLLAWIGPYIAIVVAGILMVITFRRRRGADPPTEPLSKKPEVDAATAENRRRIAQELERMDRDL